jgi:RNA polymerase sigma factor (sigma-70 family)
MGLHKDPKTDTSDLELIAEYKATKSPGPLGELFMRYKHLIMGACMKFLKHSSEAEDASMDIYIELYTKLLEHEVKNFKSWLYTLTCRHCLMKIRKSKGIVELDADDKKFESLFMETEVVEHLLEELQDETELLQGAIAQLKEGQRECIRLFYLKELSYKEVADTTGLELGQVKSHLQNGKRNLYLYLTEALKD